jgi:hypothetical protein
LDTLSDGELTTVLNFFRSISLISTVRAGRFSIRPGKGSERQVFAVLSGCVAIFLFARGLQGERKDAQSL